MANFKLGTHAVLALYRGDQLLWRWEPELLFLGDKPGFYAGGYAPPPFDPAQLFGPTTAGFYAGGYEVAS